MEQAIAHWTKKYATCNADTLAFLRRLQKSYVVYGDMLLLPSTPYATGSTSGEEDVAGLPPGAQTGLYETIAKHMKVTHIATTKAIPMSDRTEPEAHDNVLRSPLDFTPLYGDFGPIVCSDPPTHEDFDKAYWVTAKQNGIYQCWAPRWTMFSRGNISEKARLLTLSPVLSAVNEGRVGRKGCTAVDLYAGIGYFAFSYLKAGMSTVLCWDLNHWSIEGLMRGAKANNWKAELVTNNSIEALTEYGKGEDEARLVVFSEDNTKAGNVLERLRTIFPPIRHVNCGLLPTSEGSWATAVRVLDENYDGWLHVHENFATVEIDQKAGEVRSKIQTLVDEMNSRRHGLQRAGARTVLINHINRLKSYAPGVIHCVLDIQVSEYGPSCAA